MKKSINGYDTEITYTQSTDMYYLTITKMREPGQGIETICHEQGFWTKEEAIEERERLTK